MNIGTMPGHIVWNAELLMRHQGEKTAAERMGHYGIIPFQKINMRSHETAEEQRTHMEFLQEYIVQNRESVPQKSVCDTIYRNLVYRRHDRSVTDTTRKGIIAAMHTEHIYSALPCLQKMLHPVMYSIEESLPVERTALEYDCKPHHFFLLNIDETKAVTLYTTTVKRGLPIL